MIIIPHSSIVGVYRPAGSPLNATTVGKWLLARANSANSDAINFDYGGLGDVPVVGDWTGSGTTTIGVYRPAESPLNAGTVGKWLLASANAAGTDSINFDYGGPGDVRVVGNWTG